MVFNLHKKDCIWLVFPSGASINDRCGLPQGDYKDGRRLAFFRTMKRVQSKKKVLQQAIKTWLGELDRRCSSVCS